MGAYLRGAYYQFEVLALGLMQGGLIQGGLIQGGAYSKRGFFEGANSRIYGNHIYSLVMSYILTEFNRIDLRG